MKIKLIALIGLLALLAVFASGCAAGLTASSWPGITTDATTAYVSGGAYVYAVNLQNGTQTWRFPDKSSAANPFYAQPVLTSDRQLIVGGFDKKLYSLNPQTHAVNWTFTGAHDRYFGGVVEVGDTIYAPNADYDLYALDKSGNQKWAFEADQSIWGTPVSDGTNVYFGTLGRKVYGVNAQSGKQVWVQTLDGAVLGNPVLGPDGTLYVGTYASSLSALKTSDGSVLWSKSVSSWVWTGPTLDSGTLYVGDANGDLYAFSTSDQSQVWKPLSLKDAIIGSPLVTGGKLVVGTEKGSVYLLDLQNIPANPLPVSLPGTVKVYASPAAAGDLVLIAPTVAAATDPVLIALDPGGAIKWSFIPPK